MGQCQVGRDIPFSGVEMINLFDLENAAMVVDKTGQIQCANNSMHQLLGSASLEGVDIKEFMLTETKSRHDQYLKNIPTLQCHIRQSIKVVTSSKTISCTMNVSVTSTHYIVFLWPCDNPDNPDNPHINHASVSSSTLQPRVPPKIKDLIQHLDFAIRDPLQYIHGTLDELKETSISDQSKFKLMSTVCSSILSRVERVRVLQSVLSNTYTCSKEWTDLYTLVDPTQFEDVLTISTRNALQLVPQIEFDPGTQVFVDQHVFVQAVHYIYMKTCQDCRIHHQVQIRVYGSEDPNSTMYLNIVVEGSQTSTLITPSNPDLNQWSCIEMASITRFSTNQLDLEFAELVFQEGHGATITVLHGHCHGFRISMPILVRHVHCEETPRRSPCPINIPICGESFKKMQACSLSKRDLPLPTNNHIQVVCVDDSLLIRKMMGRFLERQGRSFQLFASGEAVLQWIRCGNTCKIAFVDNIMPTMSGVATVKELIDYVDVIFAITADTCAETTRQFMDIGVKDVLIKPVSSDCLAEILHTYLVSEQ